MSMSDRSQYHTNLLQNAIMSLCFILYPEDIFNCPVHSLIHEHATD